jgi:hypothetical protein
MAERFFETGIGQSGRWDRSGKMSGQLQSSLQWRGGHGERLWLSALVHAMEEAARPERRDEPCDIHALKALRAQLALPSQPRLPSPFSLRN